MSIDRLCLGTCKLGLPFYGVGSVSRPGPDEIVAILERAYALGIRQYDTGAAYGDAEDWLATMREGLPLSDEARYITKVSVPLARRGAFYVRRSYETTWPVVLLHNPKVSDWDDNLRGFMSPELPPGSPPWSGASVYTPDEARAAIEAGARTLQVPYCLLDRRHEAVIAEAKAAGVTVYARQPFLQGVLLNGPRQESASVPLGIEVWLDEFWRMCEQFGWTPVEACLTYALDSGADYVVFGVGSVKHLEETVFACDALAGRPAGQWALLRHAMKRWAHAVPPIEFGSLWNEVKS